MSFTDEELGKIEESLTSKRPGPYWAGRHARALIGEMMSLHAELGGELPFDGQIGQLKSYINKDTHPLFVTKTAPTIIRFIRAKRAEAKAKPGTGKRARSGGGKFKSDDLSTPNVNEAYADGKTPPKKTQRKASSKKTSSATKSKAKPKAAPKKQATKAKAKTKK